MSNDRREERERDDGFRSMRKFSETFLPYILMIGAAMTWYANSASVNLVENKFQESEKYTDKAFEAIRAESAAKLESIRVEAHREAEANKTEVKAYSDANRQGMRIEFTTAIGEVKSQQSSMDSKLDYLMDAADGRRPSSRTHRR